MRDEEMDELLDKAAQVPDNLKPETLARISAALQPSMQPVRPLPPEWLMTAGLVFICSTIAVAGAARAGFLGVAKMDWLERLLVFTTLATLLWAAGSSFVKEMIPASLRRVSPGVFLGLICAVLLILFALLFRDYQTNHFFSLGIVCLATGVLHAVPTGLLCWLLLRRGFAVNPVSAGLIVGTLAGLAGVGVLELHCPNFEAAHILVWHTAVIPVSSAAGAFVGWLMQRRENRPAPKAV